jgi:phenylalanyl-tRNA synthetase alpha chain
MDVKRLAAALHPLERKVLPALEKATTTKQLMQQTSLKEVEVMRALQWLKNKQLVSLKEGREEIVELGSNGKKYLQAGLPEKRFLHAALKTSSLDEIKKNTGISDDELNACLGALRKKAAIIVVKDKELKIKLTDNGVRLLEKESPEEQFLKKNFPLRIEDLKEEARFALNELRKRKAIVKIEVIRTKKAELTAEGKELIKQGIKAEGLDALTPALLKSGAWRNKGFRAYDIKADVPAVFGGKRHFVSQAVDYMKRIWLDLGFKEMKGTLIQTAFWNMDALFVPQDHPARDMQDTLYIKGPRYGKIPKKVYEQVKATHENGWATGSKGWNYKFSERLAKENLLRTHTTVLSARTIAALKKADLPAKFFSVKKVFRNETLSWKTLFEFVQVEGIVVDTDANFKHLKGYLTEFFRKMGFDKIRIRPGYFPYTEPSAEVDVFIPEKDAWIELGGSGVFRPEVTKPLIGFEVPVLAWGIGMERTIMQYYNIKDIRDLYKNDLKQLREMKLWIK